MNKDGREVADDKTLCLKIAESLLACRSCCAASKDTEPEAVFLDTPPLLLLCKQEGGGKGALRSKKVVIKCKTE